MEKENIITINQTHEEVDFNWMIKRHLPNFKDGKSTIIGVQFPWKRIFDDDKSLEETLQTIANLFNDFAKGDFFKSIHYTPKYRDIFLLKASLFSSYYWIEFIFTKDKWNLKTKGYSWEKESFIFSLGNDRSDDFIVSKINYKVSSESYDMEKYFKNFDQRKFKLPIYTNEESFEKSNYIFHYHYRDARRIDYRSRSIDLLIDEDFDYFLHIDSNEYSESTGKEINYIQQGQIPQKIFHQLVNTILNNKYYQVFGRGGISNMGSTAFSFKINKKIYEARFLMVSDERSVEYRNLNFLNKLITDWVDKIVEFQKQN
jgi:hypothetical protein